MRRTGSNCPYIGQSAEREIENANSPIATPEMIRKYLRSVLTPAQRRAYEFWIKDHAEILKSHEEAANR